jgi:hypothetical protein
MTDASEAQRARLPITRPLRLSTTENVSTAVNERNTTGEIEVKLELTTTVDQPTAYNSLQQFKRAECLNSSSLHSNAITNLNAKHGENFANSKYVQKLDKDNTARTLVANDREHLKTVRRRATRLSYKEILLCKPFKCNMCEYRSGRRANTCIHITKFHRLEYKQAARLVTVLSMDVARQTINTYNEARDRDAFFYRDRRIDVNQQLRRKHNISSKPFKCGMCEYRAAQKSTANRHMRLIHKLGIHRAKRQVKVLSLDEAKHTVEEYNKKFGCDRGRFCAKFEVYQNTQLSKESSANVKIEPVDASDAAEVSLSSEDEDSQTEPKVENQKSQIKLQNERRHRRTAVNNKMIKKLKCVECRFRSNWPRSVERHFKQAHPQVAFNQQQCIQVLDEVEALKTLTAYENEKKILKPKNIYDCKPFKCGMCEYRSRKKSNAWGHMCRVHQVALCEAKRLVEVLPLHEAKKNVREYNEKFGSKSGRYRSYV